MNLKHAIILRKKKRSKFFYVITSFVDANGIQNFVGPFILNTTLLLRNAKWFSKFFFAILSIYWVQFTFDLQGTIEFGREYRGREGGESKDRDLQSVAFRFIFEIFSSV